MDGRMRSGWRRAAELALPCAVAFGLLSSTALGWTIESTPAPTGATGTVLYHVSCPNSEWCMAVGDYLNSSGVQKTLAEHREGIYKAEEPPNPSGEKPELFGVSCPSTEVCMAVGRLYNAEELPIELAEKWTRTGGWEAQTLSMPKGGYASELGDVSCPTSTECMATGDYHNSLGEQNLAQRWSSGSWSSEAPPSPVGEGYPALGGVYCPQAKECMATGATKTSGGVFIPAAAEWKSGTWTDRTPKHTAGDTNYWLSDVSCHKTVEECVSVGYFTNASSEVETLAEQWKGGTWEYQTTLNKGNPSDLRGVFCPTSIKECIAVGQATVSGASVVFGQELLAGTWSALTMANEAGASGDNLYSVSCESLKYCFAVGSYTKSGKTWSLAESSE